MYSMNGGCLFCGTDSDPIVFDTEFDTMVHTQCIKDRLLRFPDDPEAGIMKYLLESYD